MPKITYVTHDNISKTIDVENGLISSATVISDNCIGSGCELCMNICPFEALTLTDTPNSTKDYFGIAEVEPKKCVGCRLCEQVCGWGAIYIDPPREMLKREIYPIEVLTPKSGKGLEKTSS